eukprot:CAMPEP_0181134742 /NCGR_PEP_ID=MMETSP1071-20121207/32252_1 /TAXON_ID=35127 /ORGANISM="Thalassiosira sp., Strain NH16" /LENGTH=41 /DNA_ID= /DNA_START= /DNA_END= /DNA_ORIENTATION=
MIELLKFMARAASAAKTRPDPITAEEGLAPTKKADDDELRK